MSNRNPLVEGGQPQEPIAGEKVASNIRTQKLVRFLGPDGSEREITTDIHDSRPDQQGGYFDSEVSNILIDQGGNPMPENPRDLVISHSGLFIASPEQRGICNSILHLSSRSRNILIGQDGYISDEGMARCSYCQGVLTSIYIVLGILGLGLIMGVYKGVGLF